MMREVIISSYNRNEILHISRNCETHEGKDYKIPLAGISFAMMEMAPSVVQMAQDKLSAALLCSDRDSIDDIARKILEISQLFNSIDWLSELFLTMPLLPYYQLASSELNRIRFHREEEKAAWDNIKQKKGIGSAEDTLRKVQERDSEISQSELILFDNWTTVLYGLQDPDHSPIDIDYFLKYAIKSDSVKSGCKNIAQLHIKSAKKFLEEMEKVKYELPGAYDKLMHGEEFSCVAWIRDALKDINPYVEHRSLNTVENAADKGRAQINISSKSINKMWRCYTLSGLIAAETFALGNQASIPRKCALCGKLFVPYMRRNVFCKRPNPQYGNKPCYKIGPTLKRKILRETNVVEKQYENNYRAYYNWKTKQRNRLDKYLEQQQDLLSKREFAKLKKEIKEIQDEIDINFRRWQGRCQEIKENWRVKIETLDGELDASALQEQERVLNEITLEPVKQRSIKYTQWKEDQRLMQGLD